MFKKIYEELIAIRTEIQLIRKNTAPLVEEQGGIEIKTFCPNLSTQPTVISFSLAYHDWLKLEKSKEWKEFQRRLLKYRK